MTTDNITPGERRELRSVVKGQFRVLRAEVKRREQEMKAELEQDLLGRYRKQEERIQVARRDVQRIMHDALREASKIALELTEEDPDIQAEVSWGYQGPQMKAASKTREQLHRAALAQIPNVVGDANLALDRQEVDLLRILSEGVIENSDARGFLSAIPTVGELVPTARLRELARD